MKIISSLFLSLMTGSLYCSQLRVKSVPKRVMSLPMAGAIVGTALYAIQWYKQKKEFEKNLESLALEAASCWGLSCRTNDELQEKKLQLLKILHTKNDPELLICHMREGAEAFGFLLGRKISQSCVCIDMLFVTNKMRRRGYGKAALHTLLQWFFESRSDHETICILLRHGTQLPFFKKHGFSFDIVEDRYVGSLSRKAYVQMQGPCIRDIWNNY